MLGIRKNDRAMAARVAALDALRTKVMLADEALNITYVNPMAMALMRDAEADLKKELPRFSTASLIGSSIDIFHKNPSHQHRMLAALDKPHAATIRVGQWVFDLLVTPITENGRRLGFVVEWADAKDRLLNLDHAARNAAFDRSQAIIEFAADGGILKANANFLQAMGYTSEEIRGRHHSLFVEPAFRDSPDYRSFWEALRRGEYQAGQFRRIGKGGRAVWIQASYNPVLDQQGKVIKVVKIAYDITSQMNLLANLKTLIDENFGEIDGAIALTSSGAGAAAAAAGETLGDVQSVAASAEQLAASIGQIAESMTKSRAATEEAFERTAAVGKSTETLANAAQAMTGIAGLIRNIASQINLLALNATIESARAGEAGKGFAVVASEVKNLAVQAARATEQIAGEINAIQATSHEVASMLGEIRQAVTTVRESVAVTAAAVDEQSTVTRGMSASMQSASGAVSTVSANVSEISSAVRQAAEAVAKTKRAAEVLVR